jgi:hypothetical protein
MVSYDSLHYIQTDFSALDSITHWVQIFLPVVQDRLWWAVWIGTFFYRTPYWLFVAISYTLIDSSIVLLHDCCASVFLLCSFYASYYTDHFTVKHIPPSSFTLLVATFAFVSSVVLAIYNDDDKCELINIIFSIVGGIGVGATRILFFRDFLASSLLKHEPHLNDNTTV